MRQATPSRLGGGVDVDSHGKKAGKGPLVQTELSGTLGVSQDQTLITKCISIDEKMGNTYVSEEMGNTLGARDYKQPQAVVYGVSVGNGQLHNMTMKPVANSLDTMHDQQAVITYGVDCYNQTQTEEVSKALNSAATDSDHVPCVYGLDRASFNQGKNALYDFSVEEEKAQTLVSRGPGGY